VETFTQKVTAIGGLILVIVAVTAITVLAISHSIDGPTAVTTILAVMGISGGAFTAGHAIASQRSVARDITVEDGDVNV
jgi:hypothetical protein